MIVGKEGADIFERITTPKMFCLVLDDPPRC